MQRVMSVIVLFYKLLISNIVKVIAFPYLFDYLIILETIETLTTITSHI